MAKRNIADIIGDLNAKGKYEGLMWMSEPPEKGIPTTSSGVLSLDLALGVGGYPYGRIIELYGSEGCLTADTEIKYRVMHPSGKAANSKGGTIENLWYRFNGIERKGSGFYSRPVTSSSFFTVPSVNGEGRVFHNRVVDVVKTGVQPVFEIQTSQGFVLKATADHKVMTPTGFKPVNSLSCDDIILIHNNTPYKVAFSEKKHNIIKHKDLYVRYHPAERWKTVTANDRQGVKKYSYERCILRESRAVVEAHLNGISFQEYLDILNSEEPDVIKQLKTLPRDIHVHHIDEDTTNNDLSNLLVIDGKEHNRAHALKDHNNLRFIVQQDKITSLEKMGDMDTYDIKCLSPYNNYIANNIVVHNSGKTTLTLQAIAAAQKAGNICTFIDAEHSMDLGYAQKLGVNVKDLLVYQPDYGEIALDLIQDLAPKLSSGDLIVVDSVAALTPKSEIDGEMTDQGMGTHARLMSKAMRKITGVTSKFGVTIIFVNQTRSKIGIVYGNPEVSTGGQALKYYSSIRIEARKSTAIKDKDEVVGHQVKLKVVKNKVAPPFKSCETELWFGEGIPRYVDVLKLGSTIGLVEKSGAWYSYKGNRLGQGSRNSALFLKENVEVLDELELAIQQHYGLVSDKPSPGKRQYKIEKV